jgi:aspartyl-tRNA(Asn)/glutamyl-tRNA(Gln) amidotransferase subunit A
MIAFASSLDQAGVLTRSAEDAAIMLQVMAGFDPKDSTSADLPVPDYMAALDKPLQACASACPSSILPKGLNPEVEAADPCALPNSRSWAPPSKR